MEHKTLLVAGAASLPENVLPYCQRTVFSQKREKRYEDNSHKVQGSEPKKIEKPAVDEKSQNRPEKAGEHKNYPEKVSDGYQCDQRLLGHHL